MLFYKNSAVFGKTIEFLFNSVVFQKKCVIKKKSAVYKSSYQRN